jgi:type IV secretion system protein VirB11
MRRFFAFLRAINTGHPGSMSTVHADTPLGAYEQLAMMVMHFLLRAPKARAVWDEFSRLLWLRKA